MPRDIDPALLAALQADSLQMAVFVTLTFKSGPVNIWSGVGTVTWGGTEWLGLGSLLKLDQIEEGTSLTSRGISVTLSGLDASTLAATMNNYALGLPAAVYMGLYIGGVLNPNRIPCWSGRMDQPTISVTGTEATISIACENRLIDMNVPSDRRYTPQDQQMTWPGDQGFQFVPAIQEVNITWGQSTTSTPNI